MSKDEGQKVELTASQREHISKEYGGDLNKLLDEALPVQTFFDRMSGVNFLAVVVVLGLGVIGWAFLNQAQVIKRMEARNALEVQGLEEKIEIFKRIRITNQLSPDDKRSRIIKIIEQNPASINSQDRYGRTALYNLAHWGDDDEKTFGAMARMIEAGADLNIARYQWGGGHKEKKGFLSDNGASIIQNLIRNQKHTVAVQLAIVYADKIDWEYKNYNGHSNMSYLVDLIHNNPMHLDLNRLKRIVSAYHSESWE